MPQNSTNDYESITSPTLNVQVKLKRLNEESTCLRVRRDNLATRRNEGYQSFAIENGGAMVLSVRVARDQLQHLNIVGRLTHQEHKRGVVHASVDTRQAAA